LNKLKKQKAKKVSNRKKLKIFFLIQPLIMTEFIFGYLY